jgi:hypothetical protein
MICSKAFMNPQLQVDPLSDKQSPLFDQVSPAYFLIKMKILYTYIIYSRTMDFVYHLEGQPAVQPRHFYWESRVEYKGKTQYGFIGAGSDMEGF